MNHKRHRPKCKPWKANGSSKSRPQDAMSTSPGNHPGVCKGADGWHDSHDWGAPFYEVYSATGQRERRTNPLRAPRSCFSRWMRECQRCGKIEQLSREMALTAYRVESPYGVPPPR